MVKVLKAKLLDIVDEEKVRADMILYNGKATFDRIIPIIWIL